MCYWCGGIFSFECISCVCMCLCVPVLFCGLHDITIFRLFIIHLLLLWLTRLFFHASTEQPSNIIYQIYMLPQLNIFMYIIYNIKRGRKIEREMQIRIHTWLFNWNDFRTLFPFCTNFNARILETSSFICLEFASLEIKYYISFHSQRQKGE